MKIGFILPKLRITQHQSHGVIDLGVVGGRSRGVWLGFRVDRGALVGDLSDIAVDVVGGVLHMLDPAIWKSHRVGTRDNTVGISGLSGVEVGLGVVVGNTVGVGVGLRGLLDDWVVSRGSMDYRGRKGNRSSVVGRSRGMVHHGSNWAISRCGMMYGVSHRVVDSVWHRMVHSMGNRVVDCMGNRMVDCMGDRVMDSMGNRVGHKTMMGDRMRKMGHLLDHRA